MLGIEDYGSGSDNDNDSEIPRTLVVKSAKSSSSLPSSKAASDLALPPPKAKRPAKKIAIGLPTFKSGSEDDLVEERPAAKRPRLEAGAGRSTLLTMLPAPKDKASLTPAPDRVLGGGKGSGLVFNARKYSKDAFTNDNDDKEQATSQTPTGEPEDSTLDTPATSLPFLPASLKKGRINVSVEEDNSQVTIRPTSRRPSTPTVDFFSLGSTKPSTRKVAPTSSSNLSTVPALSSAPIIPTFEPPEPSQTDEYPGYYQLPSGAWAAYDPVYYAKFIKKWQDEYNAHVRALEKGMAKGFEGLDTASVAEVNAMKEMEKSKRDIKEREERKAITQGASGEPAVPRMTLNASKTSGIARSRHQLSTLLKEAYENREALEEKIAQGKRNRKEAGNKYGF